MALIVITIRDNQGAVDVSMVDEPPIKQDATEFTPAQRIAAAVLDTVQAQLVAQAQDKPRIITLDAVKLLDED